MKLGARIVFAASLAANFAALCLLVAGPRPLEVPASLMSRLPVLPRAAHTAGDVLAYRDALLARGLALEETKPLVLARLTAELTRMDAGQSADDYWRPGYAVAAVEHVRQRVAAADGVRAQLLEIYGSQARGDSVFAALFEPLDARYAFLAAEQQLALQKLLLDRQLKLLRNPPAAPANGESAAARVSATVQASQELHASLDGDAAAQYLYRFSPLAEQIRAANVDLSESEFRNAFATLLEFEKSGDPQTFTRARDVLRSALGEPRFTKLWAARDPLFNVITAEGRKQGLAEGAISSAYAVFNDTQDKLASAADRFAAVDPQRAASEIHDIRQDMQERLASVVGQDAADALVRASTRFSISMYPTSPTNPKE